MTAAQTANASTKPAANATAGPVASGQDATAPSESPETPLSRPRRLLTWFKRRVAAALEIYRSAVARARALLPGGNKAAVETAADEPAADAHEDRREPVLTDEVALAVMQGPAGNQRGEARRARADTKTEPAESAPAAPPKPARRLTTGHGYAALAGLILGAIVGASLFWNLALVQTKRMQRAYAVSEASVEEISQLKEELAAAEQKLAEASKLQDTAKHAAAPIRHVAVPTGPDAACELSGKRSEMIEELRGCLKEFTRHSP